MKNMSINKQSGAVSLFVVVFFMLLVTVVTVSFLRLMVNDQRQASNNDLSQSAYDSAQAGVEDAKRALLEHRKACFVSTAACAVSSDSITTSECNAALKGIVGTAGVPVANGKTSEIMIQQSLSGNDKALDQAYTCVTIDLQTPDYVGDIAANQSQLVPLISAESFDRVQVQWFSRDDIPTGAVSLTSSRPLYTQANWPLNRPSLMRAQLMQVATDFTLAGFDEVVGAQSNSASVFLYPTNQPGITNIVMTTEDQRKTSVTDGPVRKGDSTPTAVTCTASLGAGGYACSAVLVLPQAIGGKADNSDRTAFLRLLPFYNATHFKVTLWNGSITSSSKVVDFKDVQPSIDSTGRANDLFRRIESRVDLFDTTFPYPEAAIEVTGNFCKDFAVTDTQYIAGTSGCTP
jgi:Tfp pilus assembly protein PilX